MPEISIVIVSFNVKELLLECIKSVISTCQELSYEIFVVDNASRDGSARAIRASFPGISLIESKENLGFARANNKAYHQSRGDFVLLLNPDVIVKPGAVADTLGFMKTRPDAGIVGCRLVGKDGSLQYSIDRFPSVRNHLAQAMFLTRILPPRHRRRGVYFGTDPLRVDHVSGAYFLVRRSAVVGPDILNSAYFMYSEEKDLALAMRKRGYYSYFLPTCEATHYGESSASQNPGPMFLELQRSQVLFYKQHYRGTYRELLVWSYYSTLVATFLASLVTAHNDRGRIRLQLFAKVVGGYPSIVWELLYKPLVVGRLQWVAETYRIVSFALTQPRQRLRLFGHPACRRFYEYFTEPHPRFPFMRNKTFCVALLELPQTFEQYMQGERTEDVLPLFGRALRMGYSVRVVNPHDYMDDIMDVNQSANRRQGREMEEGYFDRAQTEKYFKDKNEVIAVFDKNEHLRAYMYMPVLGDVCLFDRLIAHAGDLRHGVMYLMISEAIRMLIERKKALGSPKWIEYDTFIGGTWGIRYFKRKFGFKPYRVTWVLGESIPAEKGL